MLTHGLLVRLEAQPGKENAVAAFLRDALAMAREEARTPVWFAVRLGPRSFGVFDAFADQPSMEAHLSGPIAAALMGRADALLAQPPVIERLDVLGAKVDRA
ncbi:MAG: putative quinol monooxygenase [Vicinamibacterales bacterium]